MLSVPISGLFLLILIFGGCSKKDSTQPYYGQNSNYPGNVPAYTNNGDGTVTDNITGLMRQQTEDRNGDGVINFQEAPRMSASEERWAIFPALDITMPMLPREMR